ncbi:restriction endonuclease subunit S [Leptotrichia wadei]|uniref:restriction endonuclease subunit S n=1 Tax=Leptotrichia wadei TaxID=157687 RepID=UPI0028D3763D|nr:restriction endonuclease subunit S [Leptotrichia wadei]
MEIEQRRKQYEYYREKLLTFDEGEGYALSTAQHSTAQQQITSEFFELLKEAGKVVGIDVSDKVEWKTLSEVAKYSKDRISFEYLNEKNYIGVENLLKNRLGKIDSSNVPIEGNSIKFNIGDILIGNIRPYLRKIWRADVEGGTNGDVLAIRIKDKNKILSEFLYQLLSDEKFFDYNIKYSKGAKMPRGDKEKIMEYKIPLPPLPVQEYIVSILDKFDALVNDLSQGLPKEIELRQKQYEYYREKLLNFEK